MHTWHVPYQHMPNQILVGKVANIIYVSTHVVCKKKFSLWNELLSNYLRFVALVVVTFNSTYNLVVGIRFGVVSSSLQSPMIHLSFLESKLRCRSYTTSNCKFPFFLNNKPSMLCQQLEPITHD